MYVYVHSYRCANSLSDKGFDSHRAPSGLQVPHTAYVTLTPLTTKVRLAALGAWLLPPAPLGEVIMIHSSPLSRARPCSRVRWLTHE